MIGGYVHIRKWLEGSDHCAFCWSFALLFHNCPLRCAQADKSVLEPLPHIVVTFKIKDRQFIIVLLTERTRLLYWFDTSRQKRVRLQEHAYSMPKHKDSIPLKAGFS